MERKGLKRFLSSRKEEEVAPSASPAPVAAPPKAPPLEPEVLAAITAVLEIELKIYESCRPGRFTFAGGNRTHGWTEIGKWAVRPFQGGMEKP